MSGLKKKRIYILEGADCVGKTTLARAIADKTKGHIIHGSYDSNWDIKSYHKAMLHATNLLLPYQPVILDRWAVSAEVYDNAFRGGAKYSADEFMVELLQFMQDVVFIYCENQNTIKNHLELSKSRIEMFDDMTDVVAYYDKYLEATDIPWIVYDYDKVDLNDFVEEVTK